MTKETKNINAASQASPLSIFDPAGLMQAFTATIGATPASGGNPASTWIDLQQTSMSFLSDRFKQDAALFERLSKCSDPGDMTQACTDFYNGAVEDYQNQIAKITALGQQATTAEPAPDAVKATPVSNGKA